MEENERDKGLSGDMTPDKDVDDDDDDKEEGLTSDDKLLRGEGGEETKTGISDVPIDAVNPVEPCVSRLDVKCVVEGVDGDVERRGGSPKIRSSHLVLACLEETASCVGRPGQ